MKKLKESTWAYCPFYIGHTHQVIHCEGAVAGCATHLAFSQPKYQREHRFAYCERRAYTDCPVAKMLEAKYD
jgi:hypothetical protein